MKKETRRQLCDLNLLDRFLFAEAMEDPIIMQYTLEIILGKEIMLKFPPQSEHEERQGPLTRYVKLDVWAQDVYDNVYDTEVQKIDTHNIPKRSRYYQGYIDSKLMAPGEADYNVLKEVFIIIITPFDIVGEGRYIYPFHYYYDYDRSVPLNDGGNRIFLNTRGTDPEGASEELIELLRYFENTTAEVSAGCKSEKIHEMQERIAKIKSSEQMGVKFMQAWEEKILERKAAREEGLKEGIEKGIEKGLKEGLEKGRAEGIEAGISKGQAEGFEKAMKLIEALTDAGRIEDVEKVSKDSGFCQQLIKELHI